MSKSKGDVTGDLQGLEHLAQNNGLIRAELSRIMRTTGGTTDVSTSYCTFVSPDSAAQSHTKPGQRQKVGPEVLPAHNASAMVARLPSSGHDSIREVPRMNTFLEEAAALLSLSTLFGLVWLGPWLGMAFLYMVFVQQSHIALLVCALLFTETFLPVGQVWPAFRHHWLWDTWRRYFKLRVVTPPLPYLDPGKQYLFAHFPHATFPMGSWLSMPLCDAPETGLPTGTKGAIATVLLKLPLLRHVYAWMGCVPADYHVMKEQLQTTSIGLVPEGVAGIFLGARNGQERVYVRCRKGFIRLAMQTGTDIVPIYNLGQSSMLDFWGSCRLSRRLRAAVGIFWGRWGLPIPRCCPIITAVGTPVKVKRNSEPTPEEIAEVQERLLVSLVALFDQHKHLMPGWENKSLEIV
ncbi:g5091 [Coccomyxa elongata]